MDHLELELEAHIWWFCSTHEYCKTAKYELPTPSLSPSSSITSGLLGKRSGIGQSHCNLVGGIFERAHRDACVTNGPLGMKIGTESVLSVFWNISGIIFPIFIFS